MTGTSELKDALFVALNSFLERELSYDARAKAFEEIISRFVAHNPVQTQVRDMFNAFLEGILSPKHNAIFWGDRLLSLDKAAGFLDDPPFLRSYESIRSSHVYDVYNSPHTIAWRLHTLVWAAQTAIVKQGDFVECGVFKGDMSWVVMEMLGDALNDRMFFLYDSFQGMSPSQVSPQDYPDNPNFLEFANKVYSDPNVYEAVRARFGHRANVKIVRGFVPESFKLAMPDRIAYLHIDLNSASAEISVLENLFGRVVSGGVIVFDDYGWKHYSRQREAEDKFMAENGHRILELPTGQGLVVKN